MCGEKERNLSQRKRRAEPVCWRSKTGMTLNVKHTVSCFRRVRCEINARHDNVVNVLLNNILIQRGVIAHEQKWDERKTVKTIRTPR